MIMTNWLVKRWPAGVGVKDLVYGVGCVLRVEADIDRPSREVYTVATSVDILGPNPCFEALHMLELPSRNRKVPTQGSGLSKSWSSDRTLPFARRGAYVLPFRGLGIRVRKFEAAPRRSVPRVLSGNRGISMKFLPRGSVLCTPVKACLVSYLNRVEVVVRDVLAACSYPFHLER